MPKNQYESVCLCPSCGGPLNPSARPDVMYHLIFTYCHDCWVKSVRTKSRSVSTIPYAQEAWRREHHPHLQNLGDIPF